MLSHFESVDHLLDVVAASCFIPLYSATRLATTIVTNPNDLFVDGGVFAFIPPVGDVRVSAFPKYVIPKAIFGTPPHISPKMEDFFLPSLLKWSLIPAPEKKLYALFEAGLQAGDEYQQAEFST